MFSDRFSGRFYIAMYKRTNVTSWCFSRSWTHELHVRSLNSDLQIKRATSTDLLDTYWKITSNVTEDPNKISDITTTFKNFSSEESFAIDSNSLISDSTEKCVKTESKVTNNLKDFSTFDNAPINANTINKRLARKTESVAGSNSTNQQSVKPTSENRTQLITEITSAQHVFSNHWLVVNRITRDTKNKRSIDPYNSQSTRENASDFTGNEEQMFVTTNSQSENVSSNPLRNHDIRRNENDGSLALRSGEAKILDSIEITNLTGTSKERREVSDREQDLKCAEDRYKIMYPYWYHRDYFLENYWPIRKRKLHRIYPRIPIFTGK